MRHAIFVNSATGEPEHFDDLVEHCLKSNYPVLLFDAVGDCQAKLSAQGFDLPVYEPGKLTGNALAVNALELLPGIQPDQHIAAVAGLLSRIFLLSDEEVQYLGLALANTYARHANSPHYPESFPSLSEIFHEPMRLDRDEEPATADDLKTRLQHLITKLCQSNNEWVFGSRARASCVEIFRQSCVIDVSGLPADSDRSLLLGLLALFAEEFSVAAIESKASPRLIMVDGVEFCGKLFTRAGRIAFQNDLARRSSLGSHYLSRVLRRLSMHNITMIGACNSQSFLEQCESRSLVLGDADLLAEMKATLPMKNEARRTEQIPSMRPWLSAGEVVFPDAFEQNIVMDAKRISEDPEFYETFISYFLSVLTQVGQLSTARTKIANEILRIKRVSCDIPKLYWAVLSFTTDKYFRERAQYSAWDLETELKQRASWYQMLEVAFVPKQRNTIDISELLKWRERFLAATEREVGPLRSCVACTSKCTFGYDVQFLVTDPKLFFDFNSNINREDCGSSESAAFFTQQMSEETLGRHDINFSFCMALHFISKLRLSHPAQQVLACKVRAELQKYDDQLNTDDNPVAYTDEIPR